MTRAKPRIPDEVKRAVIRARNRGETITSIAARLPISLMSVSRLVREIRPELINDRRLHPSALARQRMSEFQLSRRGVWTDENLALLDTDLTNREIARRVGIGEGVVGYHRNKRRR